MLRTRSNNICAHAIFQKRRWIPHTTIGMPKKAPLSILARPEKRRVDVNEIAPDAVRAVIMGRRVPKSPKDPAISPKGFRLRVSQL